MLDYYKVFIIAFLLTIITILFIIIRIYVSNKKNKEDFTSRKNINNIKTYVINLEASKYRLNLMKSQCDRENITFTRWNAINGHHLDYKNLKSLIVHPKIKLRKGIIGCSLSHINLWKHCSRQDDEIFLVLEDDCIIPNNFKNKLQSYIGQLPADWDIFYLGASNIYGTKYSKKLLIPTLFIKNYNCGTYAMLIKKKVLADLLSDCLPLKVPIDVFIRGKRKKTYIAYPPIITHNNKIYSDNQRRIHTDPDQTNINIV